MIEGLGAEAVPFQFAVSPDVTCRGVHLAGDAGAVEWVASQVNPGGRDEGHPQEERGRPIVWVAWARDTFPVDPALGSLPCLLVLPPGAKPPDLLAGSAWSDSVDFVRQPEDGPIVAARLERLLAIHARASQNGVLLDNLPDAVFCRSFDGTITSANAAATRLLGGTSEFLAGRPFAERTGDPAAARAFCEEADRLLLERGNARQRVRLTTLDGARATFDAESLLLRDGRGEPCGVQVILSDVTAEVAARERLEREAERNEVLAAVASESRDSLDPSDLLPALAALLGGRIGARSVDIWSVNEAMTAATLDYQWRCPGGPPSMVGFVREIRGEERFGRAARGFEPVIVRDIARERDADQDRARIFDRQGLVALAGLPLRHGSELVGLLGVGFGEPREFPHDELVFLERVADQFALALRTCHLFARLTAQIEAQNVAQRQREEAEQDRQRLSAMLVHDLKNPLSAILASLDLTLERTGASDERTARMLRNSIASARGLQGLIEDALLIYRPEDAPRPRPTPSHPAEALAIVLSEAKYLADSRRIDLRAEIQHGLPRLLLDAPRVRRAAANLLTNAMKFSPPGSRVDVFVRLDETQGRAWLTFGVSDSGPGLPETAMARLATPYLRFSGSEGIPGTGLGLAVVQRVAREHGGTLEAGSNPDGRPGSLFVLRIPAIDPGSA